ncbi:ferric-chelate reductase Frp1 [Rhodosporidiobolus nylandii]
MKLEYLTWYNVNVQAFWYSGICGMIVVFAVYNGLSRLLCAFFVRRWHTLSPGPANNGRSMSTLACFPSAVLAAYRKWTYRRNQVVVWLGFGSAAQLSVFLSYLAITLSLVYCGALGHPDYSAHHAARLTYAHIPILVGLANKELGVIAIAPFTHHYFYQMYGIFAFVLWTFMVFASSRAVRRRFYKSFIFIHIICFALTVICLSLHIPRLGGYLVAASVIYLGDRICRLVSTAYWNLFRTVGRGVGPSVRVEVVSKNTIKLFIKTAQRWRPGTHIYLHCPTLEAGGHPFSIASTFLPVSHREDEPAPLSGTMVLAIRVHVGLTAKTVSARPYGHRFLVHRYESVLLVTGGTGVTFALPLMLDLVRRARNKHLGGTKPLITERVSFIWVVRSAGDVELIGDELREALVYAPPGFLDLQVYITSGSGAPTKAIDSRVQLPHLGYSQSNNSQLKDVEPRVMLSSASTETLETQRRSPSILDFRSSFARACAHASARAHLDRRLFTPSTIPIDSPVFPVNHGRPPVRDILADVVARTPTSGSVAVGTCGPVPLKDDVGAACSDTIDVSRVLRGEHRVNITLHSEVFGW